MFNRKLKEEVEFLVELNGALLDALGLDIDYCEECGDLILVKQDKKIKK